MCKSKHLKKLMSESFSPLTFLGEEAVWCFSKLQSITDVQWSFL